MFTRCRPTLLDSKHLGLGFRDPWAVGRVLSGTWLHLATPHVVAMQKRA